MMQFLPFLRRVVRAACAAYGLCLGASAPAALEVAGLDLQGFVDARGGLRTAKDPGERDLSLGELRLQLFTAFVGLNLLNYGLTGLCPLAWLLGRCGVLKG